jgi:lipopolysaccharide/colanic/teichoic acid biosynthesis glycosyltransferase
MLLQALVIRLDSPGPVLFVQSRLTRGVAVPGRDLIGRAEYKCPEGEFEANRLYLIPLEFRMFKFRTMYSDARQRFPHLYQYDYNHDGFPARKILPVDDPRITRSGAWLRKCSIDELPNLWNVLKGDIHLVGYRPELAEHLPFYGPEQMRKFVMKAGITGLAQLNRRGQLTCAETIADDLYYMAHQSPHFDAWILLRTLRVILAQKRPL